MPPGCLQADPCGMMGEQTSMHCVTPCISALIGASLWLGLVADARAAQTPPGCAKDAHFSQQDFALGDWDVYAGGRKTATVRLEKVLKGCGMRETWTPVGRATGHGIGVFTYSRLLGHWGYFWVADTGQTTVFSGDLRGPNAMLYVTEAPLPDGGHKQRHWTLTLQPDGSIQELSVGSTDGHSWSKEYELTWHRSQQSKPGS